MTAEKEQLLERIQEKIRTRLNDKFRKGDEEHKDDIFNIDLLSEIFDELIDGLTYVSVKMEQSSDLYQKGYADGFKSALAVPDKEESD